MAIILFDKHKLQKLRIKAKCIDKITTKRQVSFVRVGKDAVIKQELKCLGKPD
jgi:hypothetical protein